MLKHRVYIFVALAFAGFAPHSAAKPYEAGVFKGRIAWSADGNHNDPDDWIASPLALAIFAEMGLRDRLIHFDYNCILTDTNTEWEKIHADSVLGAVKHWGYDPARFVDVRKEKERAIDSIARAINASSEDNPLYFVVAGPMEIPVLGIRKSDPAKRKFVYCISHSRWNEGFSPQYNVEIAQGDELRIDGEGKVARLDYVQLNRPGAPAASPTPGPGGGNAMAAIAPASAQAATAR